MPEKFTKNPNYDPLNKDSKRFIPISNAQREAESKAVSMTDLFKPFGDLAKPFSALNFFTPPEDGGGTGGAFGFTPFADRDRGATPVATPETTPEATPVVTPTAEQPVTPTTTPAVTTPPVVPTTGDYTIQGGDTLGAIATKFGTDINTLASINNITDPNLIQAGAVLKIPQGAGAPTTVAPTTISKPVGTGVGVGVEAPTITPTGDKVTDEALKTLATSAGKAGLGVSDYLSLLQGVSTPSVEESTAIRNKLGIPNLIDQAFEAPDKTTTELYKELYGMSGLNEIKEQIKTFNANINSKRDDLVKATGDLNNNPWISQATRAGRLRNLQELAFADINNDIAEKEQALGLYDNAIDAIEREIGLFITDQEGARGLTTDKLNFLLTEAERDEDLVARSTLTRGLRNVPDFLQGIETREATEASRALALKNAGRAPSGGISVPANIQGNRELGNALSRSVLGLSKDARAFSQNTFNTLIQQGDIEGAKELIIQNTIEGASAETAKKLIGREEALQSIEALRVALDQYTEAGGGTGVLKGGSEKLLQKLGRTSDPVLAGIETDIRLAIQAYRSAISGAAFTESESKEYEAVFPNISRGHILNTAKLDSLERTFDRNQNVYFKQKIGNQNYEILFEQEPVGGGQPESEGTSSYLDSLELKQ